MIKKLNLTAFGKFRDYQVEFAPFTIITGENEAGKTTVFDALFDNLCEGPRGNKVFTRLRERYGKDRDSSIEWAEGDNALKLDPFDFLNIYAIRGGDLSIKADGGNAWFKAAQDTLITSGINPLDLAAVMAFEEGKTKTSQRPKTIETLRCTLAEFEGRLAETSAKRDAIISGDSRRADIEQEIKTLQDKIQNLSPALESSKAVLASARASNELAAVLKKLDTLHELKAARAKLESLSPYTREELGVYDSNADELAKKKTELSAESATAAHIKENLAKTSRELETLKAAEPFILKRGELAREWLAKARELYSAPAGLSGMDWPAALPYWFGGAIAAGLAAAFIPDMPGLITAAAIAIASGAVGWLISHKRSSAAPSGTAELIAGLTAAWQAAGLPPAHVRIDSPQALTESLTRLAVECSFKNEEINKVAGETASLAAEADKAKGAVALRTAAASEIESAIARILSDRACPGRDADLRRLNEKEMLKAEVAQKESLLPALYAAYSASDETALMNRLVETRQAFEAKGISPAAAGNLQALEAGFIALKEEKEVLERLLIEKRGDIKTEKGTTGARMEGLPEAINSLAVNIDQTKTAMDKFKREMEAYALAGEVFTEMSKDSSEAFKNLGAEVTTALKQALPASSAEFSAFDLETVKVADAGGELRPVESLSAGTRDLFMLAARIALARKARKAEEAPALLVFDEPFYTMDAGRIKAALRLIANFHKETGWQIIILTKDPSIAAEAVGINGLPVKPVNLENVGA